ncbi:hypothetical protein ACJMK2_023518 [Sinanodonta woodiana]|uniref:C-type lectin domain-containing protein n=1 Tax=Sinanodonta woodiana TaxID=1069815 RepID=A0ABD3T4I3_SINWO
MSFRTCVFHIRIVLPFLLALTVHAQDLDQKMYCPITPMDGEYFVANLTCYFLSDKRVQSPSWTVAHNDCKRTKGSLLIFKDKSNEDAVINQITITERIANNIFWLDIKRVGPLWKWTTGATVTYTPNWETGNGNCAVINVATNSWSPRDCDAEVWDIGYICQYDTTSGSSRVTLDSAILLTLVLTLYRIFATGR